MKHINLVTPFLRTINTVPFQDGGLHHENALLIHVARAHLGPTKMLIAVIRELDTNAVRGFATRSLIQL